MKIVINIIRKFVAWVKSILVFLHSLGRQEILVLGDSHCSFLKYAFLRGYNIKGHWFNVVSVKGATVSGIENPNSVTQSSSIFRHALSISKARYCVVLLGEVDVGFVLWYQAQRYDKSIDILLDEMILKYASFIEDITASFEVICLSAPLPTIEDGDVIGEVANKRSEIMATKKERTLLSRRFNLGMQHKCSDLPLVQYVNLDEASVGADGLVCEHLLSANKFDHHYDKKKYMDLLFPELNNVLSEI